MASLKNNSRNSHKYKGRCPPIHGRIRVTRAHNKPAGDEGRPLTPSRFVNLMRSKFTLVFYQIKVSEVRNNTV